LAADSTSEIEEAIVEAQILSNAIEDYYGIYEIVWALNSVYPAVSRQEKVDVARRVLERLIERDLITLHRMSIDDGTPPSYEPLPRHGYAAALRDDNWEPDTEEERVVFIGTADAEAAFAEVYPNTIYNRFRK
jgi:hypothetical protein